MSGVDGSAESLNILGASTNDSARYMCIARNNFGQSEDQAFLIVKKGKN